MTETRAGCRLKILAIHRYFWPDTPPYASMLRTIAGRWAADGHEVEVLSTQPSYKPGAGLARQKPVEQVDGVRVRRVSLPREAGRPLVRVLNMLLFGLAIARHALSRGRFDVIMASTAPPVVVGAAARWAARMTGARFLYHCMDIHPEIGRISGEFSNPLVFKGLRRLDAVNCRQAARVIVLSEDMRNAVRQREGGADATVEVINNFNLPSFDDGATQEIPDGLDRRPGVFRLLFAGNIGRFQGLEALVDAMRGLPDDAAIELLLMGEGKALEALRERADGMVGSRVRFVPHQPLDVARVLIRTADICVVSLTPGIYRYAFPSKTMTYLAEGRPLLVVVEPESELARFVRHEGIGVVAPTGDIEALKGAILQLARDPAAVDAMARRSLQVAGEQFEEAVVLDRWSALMRKVTEEV